MKALAWKLEVIGGTEYAWVARHKEGDIEFELYVSDGADGEPGRCDASPSESVWHAWVACGDDIVQTDTWMGETGFAPTNLPEAIARAEQYLRDEMMREATDEEIARVRSMFLYDGALISVDDDARAFYADGRVYVSGWLQVPDALAASIDQELPGEDPEFPIGSRGSATDVVCAVCDAVDHATEAHAAEGTVTP